MNTDIAPALRDELAEYHVLATFDSMRVNRYGDMARSRRYFELSRRADALIDAHVPVDRDGAFPSSTHDELVAAFDRVARPRIARIQREEYRARSRYTRATLDTWHDVATSLDVAIDF